MLSKTAWNHLYMESKKKKKVELIGPKNRKVVVRAWGMGKEGKVGKRI